MTTQQKIKNKIVSLENELDSLRLFFNSWKKKSLLSKIEDDDKESIVRKFAGIFGNSLESGVIYQRKIRKEWDKRFNKVSL